MADLKMVRAHRADTLDEAKVRVKQVLVDMKSSLDRHIDRVVWNKEETEAKLSGRHVTGTFKVDDENLVIALNLSFVAKLAKGIIEKKIDEIIRQRLYDQLT